VNRTDSIISKFRSVSTAENSAVGAGDAGGSGDAGVQGMQGVQEMQPHRPREFLWAKFGQK